MKMIFAAKQRGKNMNEPYKDWIVRYYASHDDIPPGHTDGELTELIRCRDCKFCKKYYHGAESNLGMFTYECIRGLYTVTADEFCSKAERRE